MKLGVILLCICFESCSAGALCVSPPAATHFHFLLASSYFLGSAAAAMMSAEAIAAGGAVASGGLVATLQSFGAVGAVVGFPGFALSLAGAAVIGAVGACVGGIITSCRSGIGGGIATGLVHGQFTVATEEGCGNVLAYTFRYEEEAWEAFDRMPCCRIIFDGSGKELDHRGANLFAFNTIRNHMQWKSSKLPGGMYSGLIFGKYVIATEEGRYNVKVYGFSSEEEAQEAFNKVPCCCILFNPSGEELDHHGSHDPSFNTIREHVRGRGIGAIGRHNGLLQGQWMVVTEEGTNNVLAYDFSEECEARKFFDDYPCFRILFDAFGNELDHRGATEALNGIRRHVRVACSYKGNIDV